VGQRAAAEVSAQSVEELIAATLALDPELLTARMQNQDPLGPMDTSQYTQQLAQYSQVEQSIQQLAAKDASGDALSPTMHSLGMVQDVVQRDGELWLGVGGSVSLPLSDLAQVSSAQT